MRDSGRSITIDRNRTLAIVPSRRILARRAWTCAMSSAPLIRPARHGRIRRMSPGSRMESSCLDRATSFASNFLLAPKSAFSRGLPTGGGATAPSKLRCRSTKGQLALRCSRSIDAQDAISTSCSSHPASSGPSVSDLNSCSPTRGNTCRSTKYSCAACARTEKALAACRRRAATGVRLRAWSRSTPMTGCSVMKYYRWTEIRRADSPDGDLAGRGTITTLVCMFLLHQT